MISDIHLEVAENPAHMGCHAGSSGNSLPTFRENLSFPSSRAKNPDFWPLEDGTHILSRKVGKQLNSTRFTIAQKSEVLTLIGVGVDCQKFVDLFKLSPVFGCFGST